MNIDIPAKEFIPEVSKQLPAFRHPKKLQNEIDEVIKQVKRVKELNRPLVEGITIDDISSRDLDDGQWAEKSGNLYKLYYHIADPTKYIPIMSAIDRHALDIGTSIYYNEDHIRHMYPPELATNFFSLNHHQYRATLTVEVDFNDDDGEMNIIDYKIYKSVFYNLNRFSHQSFKEAYSSQEHKFNNVAKILYEIGKKLYKKRSRRPIITDFERVDADRSIGKRFISKHEVQLIIQEVSILTNILLAKYQKENLNGIGIFRKHMEEYKGKEFKGEPERALYSHKPGFHYGIQEEVYCHGTSPIRRYSDNIVHRMIEVKLEGGDFSDLQYTAQDLIDMIDNYLNMQISAIIFLEKEYHFGNRVKRKERKNKKKGEENGTSSIKQYIRFGAEKGYKLPHETKEKIIKNIIYGDKKDWAWAIAVFLVSKEVEIIKALKDRILSGGSPKKFLNIISDSKMKKGGDKQFRYKEKDINGNIVIQLYYKGELISEQKGFYKIRGSDRLSLLKKKIIVRKKINFKNAKTEGVKFKLRTAILEDTFNYFLEKAEQDNITLN